MKLEIVVLKTQHTALESPWPAYGGKPNDEQQKEIDRTNELLECLRDTERASDKYISTIREIRSIVGKYKSDRNRISVTLDHVAEDMKFLISRYFRHINVEIHRFSGEN